jgi:hypothetical protein
MKNCIAYKILLVLAVITACTSLTLAAGESVSAGTLTVEVGSNVTVPVVVGNANHVAGGSIKLVFNPSIVNAASISSGDIESLVPNINNTTGFVFAAVAGSTAVGTSSTTLMNIKFTGISAGTTSLTFTSADLNDQDGSLVTPTTTDGSITVTGGVTGTFTYTVGVYQKSTGTFYLKNSITPGPADETAQYGPGGSDFLPMVGDWDGK